MSSRNMFGKRRRGRPAHVDRPDINWGDIDDRLVYGEIVVRDDEPKLRWPSLRSLAKRYSVSFSLLGKWSKDHRCQERKRVVSERHTLQALFDLARNAGRLWVDELTDLPECLRPKADGSYEPIGSKPPVATTPCGYTPYNALPHGEIERILVHGEPVLGEDGKLRPGFPSMTELAARYGAHQSSVQRLAKKLDVKKRRIDAEQMRREMVDKTLTEMRAKTEVQFRTEAKVIVDKYIDLFWERLQAGAVRADSPSDLDRLVKLRMLCDGQADSINEQRVTNVTLEDLQAAHQRSVGQLPPELMGRVVQVIPAAASGEPSELDEPDEPAAEPEPNGTNDESGQSDTDE